MKKPLDNWIVAVIIYFLMVFIITLLCFAQAAETWTYKQTTAHEIADLARALELEESNPIIVEAQRLWEEDNYKIVIDDNPTEIKEAEIK